MLGYLAPPDGLSREAAVTLGLTVLMVIWWVTEAIPIPATALLPLAVLPLAGVAPLGKASAAYMSPIVVLLMAGFIIAKAIERWGLHERIALGVVDRIGARPSSLIGGFMIAAALLSMWISNTATALMMTPIALSVARAVAPDDARSGASFTAALLLAVAYACSIGGLATPVGSPTNLIVIGYLADQGVNVSFGDWMRLGFPVVVLMLPASWFVLCAFGAKRTAGAPDPDAAREVVARARAALGPTTAPEIRTIVVFVLIALAWVFGDQLRALTGLSAIDDQIVAVCGAILFFIAPSGAKGARSAPLLDWGTAQQIPWGVVLLFGGGLSLAGAISSSGLAESLGQYFQVLEGAPTLLLILTITALVLMLTEFTSNVATVSALLPVVGAIAVGTGADLATLAAPVGLAASCAFMLPMATGPNAVAYATGRVTIVEMTRIGFAINLIAVAVITALAALTGASLGK